MTPEQIANLAESAKTARASRTIINRAFRAIDESQKWPIRGRFNATERAIRQARSYDSAGLEYVYLLDGLISEIVNSAI